MLIRNQIGGLIVFLVTFLLIKSGVFSVDTDDSKLLLKVINFGLIGFGLKIVWDRGILAIIFGLMVFLSATIALLNLFDFPIHWFLLFNIFLIGFYYILKDIVKFYKEQ